MLPLLGCADTTSHSLSFFTFKMGIIIIMIMIITSTAKDVGGLHDIVHKAFS